MPQRHFEYTYTGTKFKVKTDNELLAARAAQMPDGTVHIELMSYYTQLYDARDRVQKLQNECRERWKKELDLWHDRRKAREDKQRMELDHA